MSDNDLMEDLEAAFDQADEEATPVEEIETLETASEEVNDDAVVDEVETETTEGEETPEVEAAAEPEVEEKPAKTEKAPASWSPKAREAWGKIPAEAQAQVAKREAEVNQVLQSSSDARKAMGQFNKVLEPYKDGLIAAGHADPFSAINNVLSTEKALRSGNAQEKAYKVAELIKQYGVDIGQLDNILSGQPAAPVAAQEQYQDPRLDALLAQMQLKEETAQMQGQQAAQQTVQEFSQNAEFLPDVRMDMADLLDMATKRGQPMTMQQAYDKACAINPEISAVMAERAEQANILGSQEALESKRLAAGASLTGKKAGIGGGNGSLNLRQQIEAAWDGE